MEIVVSSPGSIKTTGFVGPGYAQKDKEDFSQSGQGGQLPTLRG